MHVYCDSITVRTFMVMDGAVEKEKSNRKLITMPFPRSAPQVSPVELSTVFPFTFFSDAHAFSEKFVAVVGFPFRFSRLVFAFPNNCNYVTSSRLTSTDKMLACNQIIFGVGKL